MASSWINGNEVRKTKKDLSSIRNIQLTVQRYEGSNIHPSFVFSKTLPRKETNEVEETLLLTLTSIVSKLQRTLGYLLNLPWVTKQDRPDQTREQDGKSTFSSPHSVSQGCIAVFLYMTSGKSCVEKAFCPDLNPPSLRDGSTLNTTEGDLLPFQGESVGPADSAGAEPQKVTTTSFPTEVCDFLHLCSVLPRHAQQPRHPVSLDDYISYVCRFVFFFFHTNAHLRDTSPFGPLEYHFPCGPDSCRMVTCLGYNIKSKTMVLTEKWLAEKTFLPSRRKVSSGKQGYDATTNAEAPLLSCMRGSERGSVFGGLQSEPSYSTATSIVVPLRLRAEWRYHGNTVQQKQILPPISVWIEDPFGRKIYSPELPLARIFLARPHKAILQGTCEHTFSPEKRNFFSTISM